MNHAGIGAVRLSRAGKRGYARSIDDDSASGCAFRAQVEAIPLQEGEQEGQARVPGASVLTEIAQVINGRSTSEIAKDQGISSRHVRNLLSDAMETSLVQFSLFADGSAGVSLSDCVISKTLAMRALPPAANRPQVSLTREHGAHNVVRKRAGSHKKCVSNSASTFLSEHRSTSQYQQAGKCGDDHIVVITADPGFNVKPGNVSCALCASRELNRSLDISLCPGLPPPRRSSP